MSTSIAPAQDDVWQVQVRSTPGAYSQNSNLLAPDAETTPTLYFVYPEWPDDATSGTIALNPNGDGTLIINGEPCPVPVDTYVEGPTPATATDNAIARWDGASGRLIQNSGMVIEDAGNIVSSGTGGNARGVEAVDLQVLRGASTQVASGNNSVIAGGGFNTASGSSSTVGGGFSNTASGELSVVSGGTTNTASGATSTIHGGTLNVASNAFSSIIGGTQNTASGIGATILGGTQNTSSGTRSTVIGGSENTAYNFSETIMGRFATISSGNQTGITASDRLFSVGNGTSSAARSDAFEVFGEGDVVIQRDANVGRAVVFEGSTADAFETTIGVVDPTADRSVNFPDASGTVVLDSTLPAYPSGANPTAQVGLTAVNGSATTFMRSDAAPALDQGITPTWTGAHTFTNQLTATFGVDLGPYANIEIIDGAPPENKILFGVSSVGITALAEIGLSPGADGVVLANATTASNGLIFGSTSPSSLYQSAANTIRTDGSFVIDGNTTLGDASSDTITANARLSLPNATSSGNSLRIGSDVDMWRSGANTLTIGDAVVGNSFTATDTTWNDFIWTAAGGFSNGTTGAINGNFTFGAGGGGIAWAEATATTDRGFIPLDVRAGTIITQLRIVHGSTANFTIRLNRFDTSSRTYTDVTSTTVTNTGGVGTLATTVINITDHTVLANNAYQIFFLNGSGTVRLYSAGFETSPRVYN